ncbi:MAG: ABC transporter permease [Acidimicrobiia bacterium]
MSVTTPRPTPEADARFVAPEIEEAEEQRSIFRRRPLLVVGLVILGTYILLAIVGPSFVRDPLLTNPSNALAPPSAEYWFGTDNFGRDVFARAVHAARLDLAMGVVIAVSAMIVGSLIGVVAGYWGGFADEGIMRITDIILAFPGFVLALIIVATLSDTIPNVVIAVSIAFIPYFIRLTRAQVLSERELEYVDGAKLAGNRPWRVAFRHVMPNSLSPSFVQATLVAGWGILTVAGLAFLGVGITPPTPEWGVMVADGASDVLTGQWWTALFPGAMIVLAVMAFHFIGDELQGETS